MGSSKNTKRVLVTLAVAGLAVMLGAVSAPLLSEAAGTFSVQAADFDFDGIPDEFDNCKFFYNPDQADNDGDGAGDVCDSDDDNDGILDTGGFGSTVCPTSDVCLPEFTCSTAGNTCAPGAGECTADPLEDFCIAFLMTCVSGGGPCTVDADCAPLIDTCERNCEMSGAVCTNDDDCIVSGCDDNCQFDANADQVDGDQDGAGDACDNCAGLVNSDQSDIDGDTIGDVCDDDMDADTILNDVFPDVCSIPVDQFGFPIGTPVDCDDNCPTLFNIDQVDNDLDEVGNVCDNCILTANTDQEDGDFDSAGDACDNCPSEANPAQQNEDRDFFGDKCDNCTETGNDNQADFDGDTIGDACDNCPRAHNTDQTDLDEDGRGAVCDACDVDFFNDLDGDGGCPDNCPTIFNNMADLDNDGIGDLCDCDRDSDGILDGKAVVGGPNSIENCFETQPECSDIFADAASLGTDNPRCGVIVSFIGIPIFTLVPPCCLDNCVDVVNASQTNADNDLLGAACDPDDNDPGIQEIPTLDRDDDFTLDAEDNCPETYNPIQEDVDLDGLGNACDEDDDGDGVFDADDNCQFDWNSGQSDADGDGLGDRCDNCVFDANPLQADANLDSIGDRCDLNDGSIFLNLDTPGSVVWQGEAGFNSWILVSGDVATLKATGSYAQDIQCGTSRTVAIDQMSVAPGQVLFFLAGGTESGIENGFGNDSRGTKRIPAAICE